MVAERGGEARSGIRGAIAELASRGLLVYLALFAIEIGLFFVISSLPFFSGEKALYTGQANQLNSTFANQSFVSTFGGIFVNNYRIALLEMVPGLGVILFAASLYATARVLEAIADNESASPFVVLVVLLLFFPHSYIELPAYAVATGAGLLLVYSFFRWLFATGPRSPVRLGDALWLLALNLVLVTVMLLVAALFESVELELGGWFLVTWVPFAVLVVLTLKLKRRADRMRKENGVEPSAEEKAGDGSRLAV